MPEKRPANNSSVMQARDVSVQKDKARLNDQRKVRPHSAGEPTMGVRPSGGSQKEPKAPALGKERMQARVVPVKRMTEAEIAELSNPISRMFHSRRDFVPGDAIGYEITKHGVQLFHVKDGQVTTPPETKDSRESIEQKMDDLRNQYAQLKQERRDLSMFPKRAAIRMARDYARQLGVTPRKIGELGNEVPFRGAIPGAASAAPATPTTAPAAAYPVGNSPYQMNVTGQTGHIQRNFSTGPMRMTQNLGSNQTGSPQEAPAPSSPAAAPTAAPAASRGRPSVEQMLKALRHLNPGKYMNRQLTPWQVEQAYNRAVQQEPALASMAMAEGYPDTSFERDEPSHETRVGGRLNRTHKVADPHHPDLNREFAQFRDLNIEKVHESANREMDELLDTVMTKMGVEPMSESPVRNTSRTVQKTETNTTVFRGRHRWV